MNNLSISTPNAPQFIQTRESVTNQVYGAPAMKEEYLPFTVRSVSNADDLRRAIHIRHTAYTRHLPMFAEALRMPESDDFDDSMLVLLAESKLDGAILGTVRIQTNRFSPLDIEQYVNLPAWMKDHSVAQMRRLAVSAGSPGRLVKMALFKACLEYSVMNDLEWIVVGARSPLDRTYEQLMFKDILDGETFIPVHGEKNVTHRVLGLETTTLVSRAWSEKHPLFNFFFNTNHPDIRVDFDRSDNPDSVFGSQSAWVPCQVHALHA